MNVISQTALACYTADWLDRYSIATLPNPNGNRSGNQTHLGATTSSTVTANNQISTDSVYNYTWDFEGNMTSRTSIATGDKEEFSYDHRNRMTMVTFKNSGGTTQSTAGFRYDEQNLMVRRIENIYSGGRVAGFCTQNPANACSIQAATDLAIRAA